MKDLEFSNVMTKTRHVFGGESINWRRGERCANIVTGIPETRNLWPKIDSESIIPPLSVWRLE